MRLIPFRSKLPRTGIAIALLAPALLLGACALHLHAKALPREESHAFAATEDTPLGQSYRAEIMRHAGQSGFHLLTHGPEALMARIELIERAQKSIDMQYFSTRDDRTGKLLLYAVTQATKRGVRVRMLLDDWNLDDFAASAAVLNADPHIEIRVFNPYATRHESWLARLGNVFSYAGRAERRMHNKAIIVDNQAAVTGGRNLGDEYFEASREINFRDIDLFTIGPVTRALSGNFDRYWNSDEAFPVASLDLPRPKPADIEALHAMMEEHWARFFASPTGQALRAFPLPAQLAGPRAPLEWAEAELAADLPGKINQPDALSRSAPASRIKALTQHARTEFVIFTPYFVPLDDGVAWLTGLVARGVNVRIVTNSLASTDMVPADAGYSHYREALVLGGVQLYEIKSVPPHTPLKAMFKPSSQQGLHAKIYMIDQRDLVIGSFNLDPRSVTLNTEQAIVVHSPALCATVSALFTELTRPATSYRVVPREQVPEQERSVLATSKVAWVTEEQNKTRYYNFTPQAGFWRRVMEAIFGALPIEREL